MRKKIIQPLGHVAASPDGHWLDLEALAEVEISSEDATYPIENALLPEQSTGWRAAESGEQTIRLVFTPPQRISRIMVHFVEEHEARTQEYVLRWSPDGGKSFNEIVRQQWNFSPDGAATQVEDYQVQLSAATVLELHIVPDISGKPLMASLQALRVAA